VSADWWHGGFASGSHDLESKLQYKPESQLFPAQHAAPFPPQQPGVSVYPQRRLSLLQSGPFAQLHQGKGASYGPPVLTVPGTPKRSQPLSKPNNEQPVPVCSAVNELGKVYWGFSYLSLGRRALKLSRGTKPGLHSTVPYLGAT